VAEAVRWRRRAGKLRKRRQKIVKHGKAFGQMVADVVRKRRKNVDDKEDVWTKR
jgi:hypothetical protein